MKLEHFISSLDFDKRLAPYDIRGSVAHARMLVKTGIIGAAHGKEIIQALLRMKSDILSGALKLSGEDVHMALEQELIKRIGPVGGKLHTARSRNDQVALDAKLYLRDVISGQKSALKKLITAITETAQKNMSAIMPGYTHLQEAQPVLFSHYLLAFAWMFARDLGRLDDCGARLNENPLGACALAGTSHPIDRNFTAKMLAFDSVTANSIDTVSDRDFILEYLSGVAISGVHISRMAEDCILWASTAFGFIELPEEYSSGSSIMPQKRNPDHLELLRSHSGLLIGSLTALLTLMKGLPLSYDRDLQEDKRVLFQAVDIYGTAIEVLAGFVRELKIVPERMRNACSHGYLEATELADYLAKKGVPFRKSHGIVKEIVRYAIRKKSRLPDLPLAVLREFSPEFDESVYAILDLAAIVSRKRSQGGTSEQSVKRQLTALSRIIRG